MTTIDAPHTAEALEALLEDHQTWNNLRDAEHMRVTSVTFHIPQKVANTIAQLAEARKVSVNGMIVEIILGYLAQGAPVRGGKKNPFKNDSIKQYSCRLPQLAIEQLRWVADKRGAYRSDLVVDAVLYYLKALREGRVA